MAAANGTLTVSVSAKQLARNVFLASGAVDGFFEDNYFDVLPGETVTVHVQAARPRRRPRRCKRR